MKLINILSYTLVLATGLTSCSKELEKHSPVINDPTVPKQISNISVKNGAGNATISYQLPNDPNLLYVKAVYTITTGKQYEVKASYYNNSLLLEGYADTLEHEVKLYSVSRSEVQSEPITAKINPLRAPLWDVYRSITVKPAFGGYQLTALNSTRGNVTIAVTKPNAFNEYEIDRDNSVYSNASNILSQVRGLDTVPYRFGFLVKDKWGNKTDTVYHTVTPIYETELSTTKFTDFTLPGDAPQVGGAAVNKAWDGKLGWPNTCFTNQTAGGVVPHMVTFNLGQLAKPSRIWIRPYPEGQNFYYLTTMKRFEIYGSANPSLNGALDNSWTLLGSYTVIKPSGQPYGADDATDRTRAEAGFDWEFDLAAPKVKYIRVRCLENFAGGTALSMNEVKVYGDNR